MKSIRTILAFLFTLIIIAGGFFLPSSTFSYQNTKYLSNSDSYAIEQTQFHYASNLLDTLNLIQRDHFLVINNYHAYKHTEDEITTLLTNIMDTLPKYDIYFNLYNPVYTDIKCYYMLERHEEDTASSVIDNEYTGNYSSKSSDIWSDLPSDDNKDAAAERSFSSYVWKIDITSKKENFSLELFLDDETGKLIALSYVGADHIFRLSHDMPDDILEKGDTIEGYDYIAKNMAAFLADHYDFDSSGLFLIDMNTYYGQDMLYNCAFTDDNDNKVKTTIFISDDRLYYNYFGEHY